MNAYFYSLDQTTLNHTINMNSFSEDPQGISGIDFHTQEARTCKISFFDDDWSNANLRNITFADCIDGTDILKMAIIVSDETYYLQRADVKYDKKTLTFTLRGIDLLGVLLILGNNPKTFSSESIAGTTLLTTTIDEILDADSDIQYNTAYSVDDFYMDVVDFQISFNHNDKFTGEPQNIQGYYGLYEADIKWRFIGYVPGNSYPVIYMIEFHTSDYDQVEENMGLEYSFIKLSLVEEVYVEEVTYYHYSGLQDKNYVDQLYDNLISNYGSIGFPDTSDTNYSYANAEYNITDSKIYFTGSASFNNVILKEGEEDSGEVELNQNSVLKSLLLLKNLYIYAKGNTIYIGNKIDFGETSDEIIADNDVVEYKESHIVFKNLDFDSLMSIFENGTTFGRFLNHYYSELIGSLNMKITAIIVNNYTLNLLTGATIYGNNFSIVKTHLDNDEIFYSIEGWN